MSRWLLVIGLLGCDKDQQPDAQLARERAAAIAAQQVAEQRAAEADKAAHEAREVVEKLEHQLGELATKVDQLAAALEAAQSDADRANAKAKLEELRREKAELEAGVAAAKKRR